MGFIRVHCEGEEKLKVTKSPGILSWSIFVGVISLGIGATSYGNDHIVWRIIYIVGSLLVAASCLEDFEELIIDRIMNTVTLGRASIFQRLLRLAKKREVIVNIRNILSVTTEAGKRHKGRGHQVALVLRSGLSLPVMECNMGHKSYCDTLADRILKFLKLNKIEIVRQDSLDDTFYYSDGDSSSDSEPVAERETTGIPRETITLINESR